MGILHHGKYESVAAAAKHRRHREEQTMMVAPRPARMVERGRGLQTLAISRQGGCLRVGECAHGMLCGRAGCPELLSS